MVSAGWEDVLVSTHLHREVNSLRNAVYGTGNKVVAGSLQVNILGSICPLDIGLAVTCGDLGRHAQLCDPILANVAIIVFYDRNALRLGNGRLSCLCRKYYAGNAGNEHRQAQKNGKCFAESFHFCFTSLNIYPGQGCYPVVYKNAVWGTIVSVVIPGWGGVSPPLFAFGHSAKGSFRGTSSMLSRYRISLATPLPVLT